jgi:hypothetical protein
MTYQIYAVRLTETALGPEMMMMRRRRRRIMTAKSKVVPVHTMKA